MRKNNSLEANSSCAAAKEIPCHLWNPKFNNRVHKRMQLDPVLSPSSTPNTFTFSRVTPSVLA